MYTKKVKARREITGVIIAQKVIENPMIQMRGRWKRK